LLAFNEPEGQLANAEEGVLVAVAFGEKGAAPGELKDSPRHSIQFFFMVVVRLSGGGGGVAGGLRLAFGDGEVTQAEFA
jgi:hypothetical protein